MSKILIKQKLNNNAKNNTYPNPKIKKYRYATIKARLSLEIKPALIFGMGTTTLGILRIKIFMDSVSIIPKLMELIKGNGKMEKLAAMALRLTWRVINMKVSMTMIAGMAEVRIIIQMVKAMKASSRMDVKKVSEYIATKMETDMKGIGKKISVMELGRKYT